MSMNMAIWPKPSIWWGARKPLDTDAPYVTGITVTALPSKLQYWEGETFDPAGMVVTAAYSDGSTRTVADYTYTLGG